MPTTTTFNFNGRRVLVTGGANGLGKAIVLKFLEAGATVYALDRDSSALESLKQAFPKVHPVQADLLNWDETGKVVESLGPLDHLVNNAGVAIPPGFSGSSNIIDTKSEDVDLIMGVNFKGTLNISKAFAKGRLGKDLPEGTIVNISSIGDSMAVPGTCIYSCSKAAISMLTKCLAVELGPNVRVNGVRPGVMITNMFKEASQCDVSDIVPDILNRAIIKKQLETFETANLVLFLSSRESSMMTGENIAIDGGLSLG